jgi:tRNA A37 threonylcarbamoyladenosine synthetase subunit TsaC/SUA5/YrdC
MQDTKNNMLNPEMTEEAKSCVKAIRDGEAVAFPTPSGWCYACDPTLTDMVLEILNEPSLSNPCILLSEEGRLVRYCGSLGEPVLDLIEFSEKPLQVYFDTATKAAQNINQDLPFMVAKDPLTNRITNSFGKPVFAAFTTKDAHANPLLNRPCHVVNLRSGNYASPENIVVMRFSKDGSFRFISNQ